MTSPIPESDLLARVFATDVDNVKHTMELVAPGDFEAAVAGICQATGILVAGGGVSAPPAAYPCLWNSAS